MENTMKKIFSILSLGLILGTVVSCVQEKVYFDPGVATPPVIESYDSDDDVVTATITPAVFSQSYNSKIPVAHCFVIKTAGSKTINQQISTEEKDNVLTTKTSTISRMLARYGFADGEIVDLSMVVRGYMKGVVDNGTGNGGVESASQIDLTGFEVKVGSPYASYTKDSDWTVIGALSEYGINWDDDLCMWTDGANNHVAAHVRLKADDEFKFRKDKAWTDNFGGTFTSVGSVFDLVAGGDNIKVGADGVYDIFFNDKDGKAWIQDAFDPYPDYTKLSNWSVIGALSKYEISWDDDLPMFSDEDGTKFIALSVELASADEFKFRQDKAWTVNMGGDFASLDAPFSVSQDGPNVKVGTEGVYDLLLNLGDNTATVTEACGLKISSASASAEPEEPEPEPITGWNIIGLNGDWNNDVLATEKDGVWTAFITADAATEFKWRKDGAWDSDYGMPKDEGYTYELGVAFPAVAGGNNIPLAAGFYKVELNLSDESNPTITVSAGDVYSLIGSINGSSWDTDFELTGTDGVYTSEVVFINGGFKIRHNFSWADEDTYGAETDGFIPEIGVAFALAQPGKDITVEAGNYRVQFNPGTMQAVITSVDYDIPEIDLTQFTELPEMAGAETWGIIGPAQEGGWNTDTDLQKIQDNPEIWAVMNIPLQADKFKFRGNDEWADYDLGGGTWAMNTPIVMTKGGGDMSVDLGVYTVYLYPTYGVAYFTEGTGDVPPPPAKPTAWSLIGTLNGTNWDTDFDLTNTSGDKWEIKKVTVTATDEFKIRADHDWNTSVGGPEGNAQSTIDPANPYEVYAPTIGTAFAAGDKNIQIGVAGEYNITFDYAAQTILIEEYKEFPEHLYMIGAEFGSWDWSSDGVVELTPVLHNPEWGANAEGQFWTVRYFTAGEGFKFCAKRAWDGDFWGLTTNDGFTEAGGNCTVAESGFYTVHIDFKASKVHVEPARIYGIGDAFGGWDEEMGSALFVADGKVLKATVAKAANIRMYAASSIATSGWWTREFNIIDGKIVPRLMGELAGVPALAGQVVKLDFNAGTGAIEGEGEAPAFKSEITVAGDYSGCGWSADNDPKLQGKDGVFKGALVMNGGAFKFVHDGTWIGGTASDLNYALNIGGGDNMTIADGTYFWTVDLAADSPAATALAITKVGLIGSFNSWSDDVELTFNSADLTYTGNVTLEANANFKVRFNGNWDYALGGSLDKLSAYGDNISVTDAGTYKVVVDLNKATVTLTPAN